MISVKAAESIFHEHLNLSAPRLASALVADRDYPPIDRVMMDGVAIKFENWLNGQREFPLYGIQAAGSSAIEVKTDGMAVEVMTGAPLPIGLDLIIPYEQLSLNDGSVKVVQEQERFPMQFVHLKGTDCRQGDVIVPAGSAYHGPHVGIAASFGQTPVLNTSPRFMLISTGDELVQGEIKPLPHQLRRSNVNALKASLELFGFHQISLAHLPDDPSIIRDHFLTCSSSVDVMIYSGGVSKGKFDYLPRLWQELGVKCLFHQVAQKPGKPLWFGNKDDHSLKVIGLPGNPLSSLMCLHRFVLNSREIFVRLSTSFKAHAHLTTYVPVKIQSFKDGTLKAHLMEFKNSGEFAALAGSDGFVELPSGQTSLEAETVVRFFSWRPWC